jgi:SHS2 domain-containing protein
MKYKYLKGKIMSDVMFEAYGKTPKELFENAAQAMFDIICKKGKVKPKSKIILRVKGLDLSDLMYNWLQGLIARVDVDEMFFSKFNITKITEKQLEAELYGESISPEKGSTLVKAVTNYGFEVKKEKNKY